MTMSTNIRDANFAMSILIILYFVGCIGIGFSLHKDLILLTPINLFISFLVILWHHPNWKASTYSFLLTSFVTGFLIEIIGVRTGLIFGQYVYGDVLGPKLFETPVIMGVNWAMLTYSSGCFVNYFWERSHYILKALMSAALMVLLDILIEPIAIRLNFWNWENHMVPLQNYGAWFTVAFFLMLIFFKTEKFTQNKVAVCLFVLQFLFFGGLNAI